eukprot:gb/GECG01003201.1/.p1 GENE.gb/GECG01003201.1/~~gb/GECG01003201.1/.p1  ORF type:complete len:618 (+),score=62.70 gb/GECG01003201.1/:1-1854(+)
MGASCTKGASSSAHTGSALKQDDNAVSTRPVSITPCSNDGGCSAADPRGPTRKLKSSSGSSSWRPDVAASILTTPSVGASGRNLGEADVSTPYLGAPNGYDGSAVVPALADMSMQRVVQQSIQPTMHRGTQPTSCEGSGRHPPGTVGINGDFTPKSRRKPSRKEPHLMERMRQFNSVVFGSRRSSFSQESIRRSNSSSGIAPVDEVARTGHGKSGRKRSASYNISTLNPSTSGVGFISPPVAPSPSNGFVVGPTLPPSTSATISHQTAACETTSVSRTSTTVPATTDLQSPGGNNFGSYGSCSSTSQTSHQSLQFNVQDLTFVPPRQQQTQRRKRFAEASKGQGSDSDFIDHKAMLDAIMAAQSRFINKQDVHSLFSELLEQILWISGAESGFVGETPLDSNNNPYLFTHAITDISWDEESRAMYQRYKTTGFMFTNLNSLYGYTLTHKTIVVSEDPHNDPRGAGFPPGHTRLWNYCGIPLLVGDRLVGMIAMANRQEGFDDNFLEQMRPLLNTAASLIEAYTSDRALQRQKQRLEKDVRSRTRQLQNETNKLQAVIHTRQQFFCKIVHEVRNPLASIKDNTYLLLQESSKLSENQIQYAKDIQESCTLLGMAISVC